MDSVFGNLDPSLYLQDPTQDGNLGRTPMLEALINNSRQALGMPPLMGKGTAATALQRFGGGQQEPTVGSVMEKQEVSGG